MGMWGESVTRRGVSHPSVSDRFTEAPRRAIDFARQEAFNRNSSAVTVADLLAGLSVDENTRAERVALLKANAFYLRWLTGLPALPAQSGEAFVDLETRPDRIWPELDPEAKRAVVFAVLEADRDRSYWIDSDHLLRGLLRFPNKAHFALLKVEVNLDSARAASRNDRAEHIPEENPNRKVIQYLLRKYAALILPPVLSLACYLYILFQGLGLTISPLTR